MRREATRSYRQKSDFKTNYYVDGNTVRRLEGEPEERRKRQQEKEREAKKRHQRRAAKRNQEREMGFTMGYVMFCTMALVLFCAVCVNYIQLQFAVTNRLKHISGLESQVANLRAENDAAVKRIDLSVDLDAVKEKAIGYGMKFALPEQIIYYSVEDKDYMDQYSDIPEK